MPTLLRLLGRSAFLLLLLLGLARSSQASHALGGDLSYKSLGNNQYEVTYRIFRDCSGIAAPTSMTLTYKSAGCAGAASTITLARVAGSQIFGNHYCATLGGGCSAGGPSNYESWLYRSTVTLTPNTWTLSITENARPEMANLVSASSESLHTEATLINRNGITNSSPVFASLPTAYLPWNQVTTFSQLAFDADGDSLVYSLAQPLAGCNDPIPYAATSFAAGVPISSNPQCIAQPTTATATYSPTFPLPSFNITGNCPVMTATPFFAFDPATGSFQVKPAVLAPASATNLNNYLNKYAVAIKVTEFRRVAGGTYVEVGTTQRDMVITVYDCGPNTNPVLQTPMVGTTARPFGQPIPVVAGQPVVVRVSGADANTGQLAQMSSSAAQTLPGSAEFLPAAPSASPSGQLSWVPPTNLAPGLYYCTVTVTDDACPIKGFSSQILTFRVTGTTTAAHSAQPRQVLAAYPTPFTGQVRFQLSQPGVQPVAVFDHLGRRVATLQSQATGEVLWQPGSGIAPGLYLARSADGRQVARLLRTEGR